MSQIIENHDKSSVADPTEVFGFRIVTELRKTLDDIAKYEMTNSTELVRGWIRDNVHKYKNDKRYEKFLQQKKEKARLKRQAKISP